MFYKGVNVSGYLISSGDTSILLTINSSILMICRHKTSKPNAPIKVVTIMR